MAKLIFLFVFIILGVTTTYFFMKPSNKEPIRYINPSEIAKEHEDLVPEDLRNKGQGHRIGSFSFTDQNGNKITNEDVKGKVHIAEYFFTTCGSICPKMTKQMKRVNDVYHNNPNVKILSFTVNPDYDSVEIMRKYAEEHNVKGDNWHFLTGEKKDLYTLARRSYFLLKKAEVKNQGDAGTDFIHTNNFVLVDQHGGIVGYYDGTSKNEVDRLIKRISQVLNEEK